MASLSSGGSPLTSLSFSPPSSSSSQPNGYWASTASDYDPGDLTPSLTTTEGGATTVTTDLFLYGYGSGSGSEESPKGSSSSSSSSSTTGGGASRTSTSVTTSVISRSNDGSSDHSSSGSGSISTADAAEVQFLDCTFEDNCASEDGGAICEWWGVG